MPSLEQILTHQQLPADWLGTIADRHGYTLARTRDPEQYIGLPSRPDFLRRVADSEEGWLPGTSREGIPLYVAFSHVNPVGWTVITGIPLDVLYAPVRHSTRVLVLVCASTLAIALLLALLIGRHIAGPIAGLAKYAQMVGQGVPVAMRPTGLRETDAVACALFRASSSLQESQVERAQAAAALHASEERKQLLHRAVLAQEAERKRIARELHDSLGQYLTALQLGLSAIGRHSMGDATTMEEVAKLRDLTSEIGREVNQMAWELRPTALDDLGLEMAIAQYLDEWAERSRLRFDLQVSLGERRLPQTVETTVYRALQEAVTNVVRHANAERVAVILEATAEQLQLIVEDDGKGFWPDTAGTGGRGVPHLGLLGMRERLALVDGILEVESTPGLGTTLFVRVPV
jgi:signal transduction histidine kinase